jgi:hypothetical protein
MALSYIAALGCAATVALLLRKGSVISALLAVLAILLIAIRCHVRADLFSTMLSAAFLALLWRYHETGRARFWLFPMLVVCWVNTHLGFFVGLGLIVAYVEVECLEMPWPERRRAAVARLRRVWPWLGYGRNMCGRVRLSSDVSEIKLVFSIPPHRPTPNVAPSWNVAPTDSIPVVRYDTKAGERSLDVMRWGLVPFWAKDIKVKPDQRLF